MPHAPFAALLALLLPAAALAGAPAPKPSSQLPLGCHRAGLLLTLTAEPSSTLTRDTRDQFQLDIGLRNCSAAALSPNLRQSVLRLNGRVVSEWKMDVQTSPSDPRVNRLQPGEENDVSFQYGGRLFRRPGRYVFVLQLGSARSEPLTVVVR